MDCTSEDLLRMGGNEMRRECSVSGCTNDANRVKAMLCEAHYYQKRRGKPFTPVRPYKYEGLCPIDGCNNDRKGKYCTKHEARIRRHGDPHKVISYRERAFPRGVDNHKWNDNPDYDTWHQRLRKEKGKASDRDCSMSCGNKADNWAYVGARDENDRAKFETDVDMYVPLCLLCHRNFDRRFNGIIAQPSLRGAYWLEEAKRMYAEGMGSNRIGKALGLSPTSVYRMLKKNGVQFRRQNGGIKSTPETRPRYIDSPI